MTKENDKQRLTKQTLFELIAEESLLDGRIDEVEQILLKRVARFLKLGNDKAREILITAKRLYKEGKLGKERELHGLELYRKALAVAAADGRADKLEATMLQGLRNVLNITPEDHKKALGELKRQLAQENTKTKKEEGKEEKEEGKEKGREKGKEKVEGVDLRAILKNPFKELKSRRTHASLWLNASQTLSCPATVEAIGALAKEKTNRKAYLAIDCLWLYLAQALRERDYEELKKIVDAMVSLGQNPALLEAAAKMVAFHDGGCKTLLATLSGQTTVQSKTKSSILSPRLEKEVSRFALEEAALTLVNGEEFSFVRDDVPVCAVLSEPKSYPRPLILLKNCYFPAAWLAVEIDSEARLLSCEGVNFDGDFWPDRLSKALEKSDGAYDVCLVNEDNNAWRIWFQSGDIDPTGLVAKGNEAMKSGDYGKAQEYLKKATEVCPWQSKALVHFAQLNLFTTSNTTAAREKAEEALMRQPFDPYCLAMVGHICGEDELFRQAVDYYERALAIFPNNEKWLRAIVKLCSKSNDEDLLYWLAAMVERAGQSETSILAQWENINEELVKELPNVHADRTHRFRQLTPSGKVRTTRIP